jgi:hypothetical protein
MLHSLGLSRPVHAKILGDLLSDKVVFNTREIVNVA